MLVKQIAAQVQQYGSLAKAPLDKVQNIRNDMYLASEAVRVLGKDKESELKPEEVSTLNAYKKQLDLSTKFIPIWVKILVAIALGLGTMIGWKRIVITVGEKIGKTHLTYGQGASAELIAVGDDRRGGRPGAAGVDDPRPVLRRRWNDARQRFGHAMVDATQHRAGLGARPCPAAIVMSGLLYVLFRHIF